MTLNLLRTELRRFFARRAILGALLAAFLLVLIVNVVQIVRSTDHADLVRQTFPNTYVDACRDGTHNGLPVVRRNCDPGIFGRDNVTGFVDVYVREGADRRIRIATTFESTIQGVGIALTLLAAVVAATFIAADFGTSIATQLLFEPRRRVVYVTKTVTAAIGCAVLAVLVLLWCGALQYAGAATRGVTTGVDGTWLVHRAGDIGRAAGAVAMMAVLAFAIGAVTRRTAGAIAVLFGLLVAMGPLHARGWPRAIGRVVPVNAIWAIAHGRLEQHSEAFLGLHMARAVVTGAAWVIGLTVLGTMWFARREIR